MPDLGRVDMVDPWVHVTMNIQWEITRPPPPALKNEREPISRGRKGNGRITEKNPYEWGVRPKMWKRKLWYGKIEDHQAAQYVADAVFDDVRRPLIQFPEAASSSIHQVEAEDMMLIQDYSPDVQLDQVEEASFDSSLPRVRSLGEGSLDPWKKFHRSLYLKDVQIPDLCDVYSFGTMTSFEIITGGLPYETIFHDFPYLIPEPRAVGTPESIQRVKHPMVADLPSFAECLEEPGDELDSESEAMDVDTDEEVLSGESGASLESHTEIASADSHGPRTEPSRKRSATSAFYDDNLSPQIRLYINQQIEEALLPLMSALRSREEDEHKHRQKMLALEQEKLALMRQKLECTRHSNAVPASVAK